MEGDSSNESKNKIATLMTEEVLEGLPTIRALLQTEEGFNRILPEAELKKIGLGDCRIEGRESNDWKLVDANDIIVHIFHPEKREFYDLEKMWSEEIPKEKAMLWKKLFF